MKVSRFFLLFTAIFLFFSINNVSASTIWASGVDEDNNWFDADKIYDDDTLLCWAASAANILIWGGWNSSSSYTNEDEILAFFSDETTDTRGWMNYAWNFWFDGTETGNYFLNSDETGFYPTLNYEDWYYEDMDGGADVIWDIADLLNDDYGVSVAVRGTMSHAITVWGVEVDNEVPTGIWLTDSDDRAGKIQYHDLILADNDRWYLQDFYGSDAGYIDEIQALKKRPGSETPGLPRLPSFRIDRPHPNFVPIKNFEFKQPIIIDDNQRNILYSLPPKVVPEPTTMLLFGFGLLGLAGVSRRKK